MYETFVLKQLIICLWSLIGRDQSGSHPSWNIWNNVNQISSEQIVQHDLDEVIQLVLA